MDRYGTPSNPVEWFDDLPGYIEFLLAQKRATEVAKCVDPEVMGHRLRRDPEVMGHRLRRDPEVMGHRLRRGPNYDYDECLEHHVKNGKKQATAGAKSGVEKTSP